MKDVLHDLEVVKYEGAELGLHLNNHKCEVICESSKVRNLILASLNGACETAPSCASLLGSPIGDEASISSAILEKCDMLSTMGDRIQYFSAHDAILLLRHSLAMSKLLFLLRSCPCFRSNRLKDYDSKLRDIVSNITKINFSENDRAWSQATLPVKSGGLGIRCAVQLATSAFLSSGAASNDLVNSILPSHLRSTAPPFFEDAIAIWSQGHDFDHPKGKAAHKQKVWDSYKVSIVAKDLLDSAPDAMNRARILASSAKESGAWLNVLPLSSLGLRMDDNTIRIAVGLRIGSPLCYSHTCYHCGLEVNSFATHGVDCMWSRGQYQCHSAINDIIRRTLLSANVPSHLEPSHLSRDDGKRPDGVTKIPWKDGKLLVWDFTCPDTLSSSSATSGVGIVADLAEQRAVSKYTGLNSTHIFTPVVVESLGVMGPLTHSFLKELGRCIRSSSGEDKAYSYLIQRLSVAVQRGNSASVFGM